MTEIKLWMVRLVVCGFLLSVCDSLLPKGKFQTIARIIGGLTMIIVIFQLNFQGNFEGIGNLYEHYEEIIEENTEIYQTEKNEELMALIAEKTEAYIEEKAASLGVECHAKVECEMKENVPFPAKIVVDIPYSSEISKQIEDDLNIKRSDQFWEGELAE